jgi:hypothetical protein
MGGGFHGFGHGAGGHFMQPTCAAWDMECMATATGATAVRPMIGSTAASCRTSASEPTPAP